MKKIILSLIAIVLTIITLGTTTYAWFTVATAVQVEGFNLNIKSFEGLDIALLVSPNKEVYGEGYTGSEVELLDPDKSFMLWKNTITKSDVIDAYNYNAGSTPRNFDDVSLDALTSTNGTQFYKATKTGKVNTNPVNSGWFELTIYFRTSNSTNLYLKNSVLESTAVTTKVNGTDVTVKPSDALRISVETFGASTNGFKIAANSLVMYEPYAEEQSAASLSIAQDITNNVALQYFHNKMKNNSEYQSDWNYNPDETYDESKPEKDHAIRMTDAYTYEQYEFGGDKEFSNVSDNNNRVSEGYYYAKSVIRFWIEGWDKDAFDIILNKEITINLQFTTSTVEESVE